MAIEETSTMALDQEEIKKALSDKVLDSDTKKYLIFRACGILYGVEADYVESILHETMVTYIPMVPPHVSGVINLRGQIVPVIDFRILLGRMPGEECCPIVLDIDNVQIGILTDSVDQMVDINRSAILPVPSSQHGQNLICGMCTLPGGHATVMVLDCSRLLHG